MDLTGKNVVYVGGFGGIGFSACKELIRRKLSSLVILDIVEKPELVSQLKQLNPSVDVFSLKLDLCDKKNIEDCLKNVSERTTFIDVLVNGSGVALEKDIESTVGINLVGLIHTTLLAIPLMDKSLNGRGGIILNMASMLGLNPAPTNAVYSASKHGVVGFTRSIAHEYYFKRTGIAVMAFCPGLTVTSFLNQYHYSGLTFPYSGDVSKFTKPTESQTSDECGRTLVEALETGKSNSVWKSNAGVLEEITMLAY